MLGGVVILDFGLINVSDVAPSLQGGIFVLPILGPAPDRAYANEILI